MSKTRVHFATIVGGELRASQSICGMACVRTTQDAGAATCRLCLARLRAGLAPASTPRARLTLDGDELADALHIALASVTPTLQPAASFPPRLSPSTWASSCKGAEHRKCGECELCLWDRDAALWNHVAPWNKRHHVDNSNAPRFSSVDAALIALVRHQQTGRVVSSSLGGVLERLKMGTSDTLQRSTSATTPRPIASALDVLEVQVALERAYADSVLLEPAEAVRILLERTPGLFAGVTTYEALSKRYQLTEGQLQAIVRTGRKRVGAELVERGLLRPPATARPDPDVSSWRALREPLDAAHP